MKREDDDIQGGFLEDGYPQTKTLHYGEGFGGLFLQHIVNRGLSMTGQRLPAPITFPALLPGQLNIHGVDGGQTNHSYSPGDDLFYPALIVSRIGESVTGLWVCNWSLVPQPVAKNLYWIGTGSKYNSREDGDTKYQVIVTRNPPTKTITAVTEDTGQITTSVPGPTTGYYYGTLDTSSGTKQSRIQTIHRTLEGAVNGSITFMEDISSLTGAHAGGGGTPSEDVALNKTVNSTIGQYLQGFLYFPTGNPDSPKNGEAWYPAYSIYEQNDDSDDFTASSGLFFALNEYHATFSGNGFPAWNTTDSWYTYRVNDFKYVVAGMVNNDFQPFFRDNRQSSKSDYGSPSYQDNWFRASFVRNGELDVVTFPVFKKVKSSESDQKFYSASTVVFGLIQREWYNQSDYFTSSNDMLLYWEEHGYYQWAPSVSGSLEVALFNEKTGRKKASLLVPKDNANNMFVYQGFQVRGVCLVYREKNS